MPVSTIVGAAEALAALWLARILVNMVPYPRWRHFMGPVADGPSASAAKTLDAEQMRTAERLAGLMGRVARHAPFEAVCLPRALALRWLLRRRGIPSALHLGVRPGATGGAPEFHAWLEANGRCLIGVEERDSFAPFRRAGPSLPL